MNDMTSAQISATTGDVMPDMTGIKVSPNPHRTLRHKLQNQWNKFKGCACAGVVAQGGIHSICVLFAGVSGATSSSVSRLASAALQGNGLIGLTAAETFQYIAAPALAVPISYGVDMWRKSQYSLSKAGVAIAISATVAAGIAYQWPHQHDADMAVSWFETQSKDEQQRIRQFALDTKQTVNEVALGMCSSNPDIQAKMDQLKKPAYTRVYEYFRN